MSNASHFMVKSSERKAAGVKNQNSEGNRHVENIPGFTCDCFAFLVELFALLASVL